MQCLSLVLVLAALAAPAFAGLAESCARSSRSKCRDFTQETVAPNQEIELRTYPGGSFAVSSVMVNDPSVGLMSYAFNLFMPLWNYMKQGANAAGQNFEMSMPAPIKYERQSNGQWKVSLGFYLGAAAAPAPTGMARSVQVVSVPDQRVCQVFQLLFLLVGIFVHVNP